MTSLHMYFHLGKYFDKDGQAISAEKHSELWHNEDYYRVAADQREGVFILTTWKGVDLAGGVSPKPFIFETRMFTVGDPSDQFYVEFSASSDSAIATHQKAVKIASNSKLAKAR